MAGPGDGGVREIGRVRPVTIPAAELAVISHRGSLGDADLSYATLGSYATRHEISIDGPLREYYLRGVGEVADETEWRTEIGWPIFRADGPREPAAPAAARRSRRPSGSWRLRFPRGWRPGGSPRSSARPGSGPGGGWSGCWPSSA